MQPALGRRRHRRSNNTISLVSRGYVVGCYVRSPSQRWKCVAASSASHPVMRAILPLLYAHHRLFAGLGPSGLTPSSVLKCGLINHRDGVMTYVSRDMTPRRLACRNLHAGGAGVGGRLRPSVEECRNVGTNVARRGQRFVFCDVRRFNAN